MHDSSRIATVLMGSWLLTACGGGGGGGTPAPAAPNPPALPPAFAFGATNAIDAASFALNGAELAWLAAQYPPIIAEFATRFNQRDIPFSSCGGATTIRLRHLDNDANNAVSAGDVLKFEFPRCAPYTMDVSLTVATVSLVDGQVASLAGNATFDVTVEAPGSTQIQSAPLLAQATGARIAGSFKLAYNATMPGPPYQLNARRWLLTEVAATITSGGTVETLSGGVLDKSIDAANAYQVSVSGSIASQRLGTTLTVSTPAPLAAAVGFFPKTGELLLTSGASKLRLRPTADASLGNDYADVAVDAAGGGYGAPEHLQWLEFVRGTLFGWFPNDPPVITHLQISPEEPTRATGLFASLFATDRENDAITIEYEWRRNGAVLEGQASASLPGAFFARGDEISVTGTARDLRGRATRTATTTIRNAPPQIFDTGITPATPHGADDLSFVGHASDLDDDPLSLVYVWKRNGVVIAGQTARTLPASFTTPGDTIEVVFSADDGSGPQATQASVTIVDTPATITLSFVPPSVAYGAHVTFDATATDPDQPGTALRFKLAHGPAGMAIDPSTGAVVWDARPPMFDNEMEVHFGVAVEDDSGVATGTIKVADAARPYALMRTGIEIPLWPAGLSVGDFDSAGGAEMMVLSHKSLYELKSDGAGGYRQAWMYPFVIGLDPSDPYYSLNNATAMTTGDANGDGKHEIFVAAGQGVYKLDGITRRIVASRPLPLGGCRDLKFANLDGGAESELVCLRAWGYYSTTSGMVVLGANDLAVKWEFPSIDFGASIAVGNVDADARLEIVTAAGYVYDGGTYANEWLYGAGFGRDVETGDLDGNGIEEIVGMNWGPLRGFSATLKSPLWEIPSAGDSMLVTNIDADAAKEVIVGDNQWGNVTAYDYDVAHNTLAIQFQINSQDHGVTSIGVGDVDHDGRPEIIWGSGASSSGPDKFVIAGRNPPTNTIEVEWTNTDPLQLDGPFFGGSLSRSTLAPTPMPMFGTARSNSGYAGTRLIRMNPATGDLAVSPELGSNWNGTGSLAVSDYDNDGVDEVFLGSSVLYDGFVQAYDFFNDTTEWASPSLPFSQSAMGIERADVTGDGHDDLVAMSSAGVVFVHNVFASTLFWQSTTLNYGRDVIVTDFDRDGSLDIIAVTNDGVYVYERIAGPVTYVQTATRLRGDTRDAVVVDLDGDGDLELVLLSSNRVERYDHNLQLLGGFDVAWRGESLAVEPSSGARKNLLLAIQDYNPKSAIVAVDALTGGEVWRSPDLIGAVSRNALQFVTIGGEQRLSFGTNGGMYLTR